MPKTVRLTLTAKPLPCSLFPVPCSLVITTIFYANLLIYLMVYRYPVNVY
ncbi:MAG: hypothetical protein ACK57T_03080 [Dolichospermum sp.]